MKLNPDSPGAGTIPPKLAVGAMKKGMVYNSSYSEISFTVPLFHDFMKRAIPTLD